VSIWLGPPAIQRRMGDLVLGRPAACKASAPRLAAGRQQLANDAIPWIGVEPVREPGGEALPLLPSLACRWREEVQLPDVAEMLSESGAVDQLIDPPRSLPGLALVEKARGPFRRGNDPMQVEEHPTQELRILGQGRPPQPLGIQSRLHEAIDRRGERRGIVLPGWILGVQHGAPCSEMHHDEPAAH
jgi:hypothetical protein